MVVLTPAIDSVRLPRKHLDYFDGHDANLGVPFTKTSPHGLDAANSGFCDPGTEAQSIPEPNIAAATCLAPANALSKHTPVLNIHLWNIPVSLRMSCATKPWENRAKALYVLVVYSLRLVCIFLASRLCLPCVSFCPGPPTIQDEAQTQTYLEHGSKDESLQRHSEAGKCSVKKHMNSEGQHKCHHCEVYCKTLSPRRQCWIRCRICQQADRETTRSISAKRHEQERKAMGACSFKNGSDHPTARQSKVARVNSPSLKVSSPDRLDAKRTSAKRSLSTQAVVDGQSACFEYVATESCIDTDEAAPA
jgi:hypothetical protein